MRKKIILFSVLILLGVAAILILTQQPDARFEGERISDQGSFVLRFDRMNMTDSETLVLRKGDALHVSWQIESGHVDIVIRQKNEEPIYQADDRAAGDKADFYVEIPQTGSYTITVSSREAKGQISFFKTDNE